jgi:GNAT superfamily N-acetyltransferase
VITVEIDPFEGDHIRHHDELFSTAFPPGDTLLNKTYLTWLYRENPFGPARMVRAIDAGRWIGFMAMIPLVLVRRRVQVAGYCVVNVVVDPKYRGHNIFGRMIASAIELVLSEQAVLVGYPNDMALKAWERSGMHFQTPLRPYLALPTLPVKGVRARRIMDVESVTPSLVLLEQQAAEGDVWRPLLNADFVRWRYLQHPVKSYGAHQIEVGSTPAGFMISRRIRPSVNVLVGDFTLDRYAVQALRSLPFLTVALKPEVSTHELPHVLWPLPVNRRVPFFCTHYQQPFEVEDTESLGLSLSDF